MEWLIYVALGISIFFNIFFIIKGRRNNNHSNGRDKELRTMFNNIENEIRQARTKYGLNK